MKNKNKNTKIKKGLIYLIPRIIILMIIYFNITSLLNWEEKLIKTATADFFDDFSYSPPQVVVPKKAKKYLYNDKISIETIKNEIIKQAKFYGNDIDFMIKLADCESDFNNFADNKNSSALGIYQYLDSTWRETESWKKYHLSRTDYKANIKEAMLDISNGEYFRWAECIN